MPIAFSTLETWAREGAVWHLATARVTIFPPRDTINWIVPGWGELLGGTPENQVTASPGVRLEEGPAGKGRISVQRQTSAPMRMDIRYGTMRPSEPLRSLDADLGSLDDAISALREPAAVLFSSGTTVGRLAFGVELLEPVSDMDSALQILSQRIDPARFDLSDAREFVYQINRRRFSKVVPGLLVNRLAKWQPVQFQVVEVDTTTMERKPEGTPVLCASLSLDVNSDANFPSLPQDRLGELLAEFQELATELATRGDQK